MYRHVPPIVKQSSPMHCYAAGFESWFKVTPGAGKYSQAELVQIYGDQKIGGGAPEPRILSMLSDHDIAYTHWNHGGTLLTEDLIATHLITSHVVLIYKSSQNNSHTLVIYGVSHANGVAQISFMDPWYGSYRWENLETFNGKPWLLAWKK